MKSGEDLQIISLNRVLLKEALENNTYWNSSAKDIPFSTSKAFWLLENERIEDDDICAVIATSNNKLVSLVYLVPDLINTNSGIKKVYWSRRWWIHADYKKTVLPTYIIKQSETSVKNQVIIKFLGKDVVEYYKKQPFIEISHRTRYYLVFNVDASLLINKFKFLKYLNPLVRVLDRTSQTIISAINKRKLKTDDLTYDYVATINEDLWQFLSPFYKNDLVPKSKSYLNWQINNNQYSYAAVREKRSHDCLIASIKSNIYNLNFSVIKNNKRIGFISFLIRDKEAIVRYFTCANEYFETCADALMEQLITLKTGNLQTENEKLGQYIQKKYLNIYTDKRKLYGLINKNVSDVAPEDIVIHDQDGNFA